MSASIYRNNVCHSNKVAEFESPEDAVRCFKSMAYDLGDRLIMVVRGEFPETCPENCHVNSLGQYVLFPSLRTDRIRGSWDQ